MSPPLERSHYRPSGRFCPSRLLLVLALLPLTASAIGAIYFVMLALGWYLLLLSIAFTVGTACSFSGWAIQYAHCRNRVLAAVVGVLSGLGGYLGYFHIDQVIRWGVPVTAVHRLPSYIAFRMATDTWIEGAVLKPVAPAPGIQPVAPFGGPPDLLSWGLFLFDILTLSIAPAATAIYMAGWPYSEKRRRWCNRESLYLAKQESDRFKQALREGELAAWATTELRRTDTRQPHFRITVWYTSCETAGDADTAVFVSIDRRRPLQLELDEAAALVPLFPGLQALAGVSPVRAKPVAPADFDPLLTHIWQVPPLYAGPLYTPLQRRLRYCRRFLREFGIPVIGFAILICGNVILLGKVVVGDLPPWVLPAFIAALAIPLWLYVQIRMVFFPIDIWVWHFSDCFQMLLDNFARRPDPLVNIDDPDAIYVELLPRRLWELGRVSSPEDSNEGLLRFDWDRGVALFEAENQRMLLCAASILSAQVEVIPGASERTESPYCVLLQVRTAMGVWDLPFFPLLGLAGKYGRDRALILMALFEDLRDQNLEGQTDESPTRPVACSQH